MDGCLAPFEQREVSVFILANARADACVSGWFYVTLSEEGWGGGQGV